jgi:hypothetical protein
VQSFAIVAHVKFKFVSLVLIRESCVYYRNK